MFNFKKAPNGVVRSSYVIPFAYNRNLNVIFISDGDLP